MAHTNTAWLTEPQEKTGAVVRVLADKGFAFLVADGEAAEYFAHKSAFVVPEEFDGLRPGDRVRFTGGATHKGPRAQQIVLG